jgi:hypothetical protein
MGKTPEQHFADWEGSAFGFGYGSGEPHTLAALKGFMDAIERHTDRSPSYDYQKLEAALSPAVAWLLINALCRHPTHIIEYGSSPRFGWLTKEGERLRAFIETRSTDDLVEIVCSRTEDYNPCYPDACNCGPNGYEEGRKCDNPFWVNLPSRT